MFFRKQKSALPGFRITITFTVIYLLLIVLIPLSATFAKTSTMTWGQFWSTITDARVVAAYKLSFGASAVAAFVNLVFGLLVTWVLVRYKFPGKKFIDAMVDLPFALPTAVAGLALTAIYSKNGWLGQFTEKLGFSVAFNPLGVFVALIFIGLPFVVRTVQPILEDMEPELEEAAASLGASRLQTFFRIVLPELFPALLTGFSLAFARALGEYGSVVFISGNKPMETEIVPLLIITKLEQYDYAGATALAVVMLIASFTILLLINALQRWSQSRTTN